jgi:hypothetical protein
LGSLESRNGLRQATAEDGRPCARPRLWLLLNPSCAPLSEPIPLWAGKKWRSIFQESGIFDVTKLNLSGRAQPRSPKDLLVELNLPQDDFCITQPDTVHVWLNDQPILDKQGTDTLDNCLSTKIWLGVEQIFG